jgi:hypothetical protein
MSKEMNVESGGENDESGENVEKKKRNRYKGSLQGVVRYPLQPYPP